jgi:hypothetical protein
VLSRLLNRFHKARAVVDPIVLKRESGPRDDLRARKPGKQIEQACFCDPRVARYVEERECAHVEGERHGMRFASPPMQGG